MRINKLGHLVLGSFVFLAMLLAASASASTAELVIDDPGATITILEGDVFSVRHNGRRSIASASATRLWIDGIVPYSLDPTLPSHTVKAINIAIDHWNQASGITLLPMEDVASTGESIIDSVVFKNRQGCASWVGRQGGVQEVWVGANCTSGSVMHEIGHVLGLEHEHTRPDRDQYITIHWGNMTREKAHNFDITQGGTQPLHLSLDL